VAALAIFASFQFGVAGADETTSTTVEPTTTTVVPTTEPPVTLPPVTTPPPTTAPPAPPAVDDTTSTSTTTTIPPQSVSDAAAAAYVDTVRARSGANSSAALMNAVKTLETLGFTPDEAIKMAFGHFPVAGLASFTDDFGDFRAGPPVHGHQGTDVFAAFNTPVRAPFDGVVRFGEDRLGGMAAYLTQPDGTFFYMCHLNAYAPDVPSGSAVTQGRIIGLNGDSGDAKGGSPHVHFEIHPGGGPAVNPKPFLDAWLAEALAAIPKLVGATVVDQPAVIQSTGLTRRFDLTNVDQRVQAPVEPLLWASSVNPAGSALRLAQVEAAKMAENIDWDKRPADAPGGSKPLTAPALPGAADAPRR